MYSLKRLLAEGRTLVGVAAGSGMSAAAAETGGADLLLVLNAGHYRQHGLASMAALLPYGDVHDIVWDLAVRHVLPRVKEVPVFIGLSAHHPDHRWEQDLSRVRSTGLAGITNFPSVGFIDGAYRRALEERGIGYDREVEMIGRAREAGLLTVGFALSPAEAAAMAGAAPDLLCLDLGFADVTPREAEERQARLDEAVESIGVMLAAARKVNAGVPSVIFGGPVVLPADLAQVRERTGVRGYIGGSTIERLPAMSIISQTVRDFKEACDPRPGDGRLGGMIGTSAAMRQVFHRIRRVAGSDATVLIVGESGVGKELAAREITRLSPRRGKPLVSWNCAATTESLAMSELFGHVKGAFTGAVQKRVGRFEAADGGTLFMDEIADLPLPVQASLLRALQEKEILRVGGDAPLSVDVRLIAATNRNFGDLLPSGRFRADLYHRLSTFVLRIPPLGERREDIPLLVREFLEEFSRAYACAAPPVLADAMDRLVRHDWPGNIRQLRNVVERSFILWPGEPLTRSRLDEVLTGEPGAAPPPAAGGPDRRRLMAEALQRHGGNKSAAARDLGVTRKTLYAWLSPS